MRATELPQFFYPSDLERERPKNSKTDPSMQLAINVIIVFRLSTDTQWFLIIITVP